MALVVEKAINQAQNLKQCNSQSKTKFLSLSPNRDPCVIISSRCYILNVVHACSTVVHKCVWILVYFTLVSWLFSAVSISIFNIFKYYFYTSINVWASQRGLNNRESTVSV